MKKMFAAAGTLLAAGTLFALSFVGGASAVETSGTLSVCVNDRTGEIRARENCSASETHWLVEAEEVVVPANPRPTPTSPDAETE